MTDTPPADIQTLIDGVRGRPPERSGVDWRRVSTLAVAHGVGPLLHHNWRHYADLIPPATFSDLKRQRHFSALTGVAALRQLDAVVETLRQADIPHLVLKGAAMAVTWYQDVSLRPFLDLDILVSVGDIRRAEQALDAVGYHGIANPEAPHHVTPLHKTGTPCSVELHFGLTRLPASDALTFEELEARAITVDAGGIAVRTLAPEDMLLHLCLHLLSHVEYDHGWQLRHLCDIDRHVQRFDVDWPVFEDRARNLPARRGCQAALGLTQVVLGTPMPAELTDLQRALALLRYPVPGQTEHRVLADFLAALGRFELPHAAAILLGMMSGREQTDSRLSVRLRALLTIMAGLLQESARNPRQVADQLRLWLPEAQKSRQRERLLADLLSPPDEVAARQV